MAEPDETELRKRITGAAVDHAEIEVEDDAILTEENVESLTHDLPRSTDKTTPALDSLLAQYSARWRNWVVRLIFSVVMVLFFCFIISRGPLALMATFALTHVTLVLIVVQSFAMISNLFQGMIWFLVPASMIVCNDIMAYMFGFFFGKTKLIDLSPKKTWEGFLGGGVSTVVFGLLLAHFLSGYRFFVCPVEYSESAENFTSACVVSPTFRLRQFSVPAPISLGFRLAGRPPQVTVYPFLVHAFFMGIFAGVVGPIGGFFASGFKRAFKIKDFSDVIPGHGGLMDRFDCQLLMGSFVYVYIQTFIRVLNPMKIIQLILFLRPEEQLEVYRLLTEKLKESGILT